MRNRISPRIVAHAIILGMLVKGSVSRAMICQLTGLPRVYVLYFLKELRERKTIYRSGLGPDSVGRLSIELFSIGNQPDVERPTKPRTMKKRPAPADVWDSKVRTVWVGPMAEHMKALTASKGARRKPLVAIPKAISEVTSTE